MSEGASALDALFWRDEILAALYWMQGEGLTEWAEAAHLAAFLAADGALVTAELDRLAAGGYVEVRDGLAPAYRLTTIGRLEGGRSFADGFAGLTEQAHGQCSPGCWCQDP